jgi:phosphonate transport system ATP-binding protein
MTAILQIDRLNKTYENGTVALREISFSVKAGEFVVILGKSGSGKSTLMRCINRLVEPTAGRIILDEEEVTNASPTQLRALRKKIGMIFQQYNLIPRYSVGTNALMGCLASTSSISSMLNCFTASDVEHSHQILDRLGLAKKYSDRSEELSGGQQQRVGLARSLMQGPELILADEPVSSLDPATSQQIMSLLAEINEKEGVTVLCNLHLPALARQFGSRILALNEGRIVYDGPAKELSEDELNSLYDSSPSEKPNLD